MNPDFDDLLQSLLDTGASFLIVGAHAMAVHGVPRATGDLDIWVEATEDNAARVIRALANFGAPIDSLGITAADLVKADVVIQIGLPPRRIDFLTGLSGLAFAEAWPRRVWYDFGGRTLPFLDRESLVRNKRATGRVRIWRISRPWARPRTSRKDQWPNGFSVLLWQAHGSIPRRPARP